jgi:hypothetical protein
VDVDEEDCLNIKTEEDHRSSVCLRKMEYEVSVVCACVVYCAFQLAVLFYHVHIAAA